MTLSERYEIFGDRSIVFCLPHTIYRVRDRRHDIGLVDTADTQCSNSLQSANYNLLYECDKDTCIGENGVVRIICR